LQSSDKLREYLYSADPCLRERPVSTRRQRRQALESKAKQQRKELLDVLEIGSGPSGKQQLAGSLVRNRAADFNLPRGRWNIPLET
jgi:hypothetical protein